MTYTKNVFFQDEPCIELCAGGYLALFAPKIGGLMLRLKDTKNNIEILKYSEDFQIEDIRKTPLIYGLPTLFLPNRLHNGILKTSEKTYTLPINEPDFGNFIHGFLHLREYIVTKTTAGNNTAAVTAEYVYDERDEFFKHFPVSFKAEITYTLSDKGLEQDFVITNLSDAVLPVGVCSHTALKCPFSDGFSAEDLSISINITDKLVLNDSLVCTGEFCALNDYDLQYKNGTMNPLTTIINNDMYSVDTNDTDGNEFYGVKLSDAKTGATVCYETGEEFKYWLIWNEWGNKGYCCAEPMSWMIDAPNIFLDAEKTGYAEIKKGETWQGYQHLYSYTI